MSRRARKFENHFAIEGLGLAYFSTEWGHFFGSNVDNKIQNWRSAEVKMISQNSVCVWLLLIRLLSLMIKTILIYYIFAALLPLYFQAKNGDLITTGQYMNHRTFGSPQLRPVLKNFCTSPPDQCSKFLVVHLLHLQKVFGKKKSHFNIKLSSRLQDAWIQIWLNLLRHKMQRLWVVEKVLRALHWMWED